MKGSQIGIIGGGIAAAVIIAVLLVSQTGISQRLLHSGAGRATFRVGSQGRDRYFGTHWG